MERKLLVVDDKREVRQLIKATLEYEGWVVIEAENGDEAVASALLHKPDLIIMDMIMPGKMNGLEATKYITTHPDTSGSKVIMLSGLNIEMREAALEAGVIEFIQKPFSPLDLINKVVELFGEED